MSRESWKSHRELLLLIPRELGEQREILLPIPRELGEQRAPASYLLRALRDFFVKTGLTSFQCLG